MRNHLIFKGKPAPVYLSAQDFLAAASEYFQWVDDNPLQEEKLFAHQGEVSRASQNKVRPYTKKGLAIFLGIPESRLNNYSKRAGWEDAMEILDQIIYTQKFENAAAGLMNATIIGRDLGLAEKQEVTGAAGGAIKVQDVNSEELLLDEARRLGIDLDALGLGKTDAPA